MGNIVLIRHGESTANVDGKLYSHEIDSVISLTHKGIEDTVNFAKNAKVSKDFSAVLCSPLHRAQQTAAILAELSFFDMSSFAIDDELYELTTAVGEEDIAGYLSDPYYTPVPRTLPMIYGGMRVGHPRTLTFTQGIIEALSENYLDDTLIVSHQIRIRAIMAANAVAGYLNDFGIEETRGSVKVIIERIFKYDIKNTVPYTIVNEKLSDDHRKEITQLLCSLGNSN